MATYNATAVCERMADVVREFPNLDDGERELWAESWIAGVEVKKKEAAIALTPPLPRVGVSDYLFSP